MTMELVIQGRKVKTDDIQLIHRLLKRNPSWHRTRLSIELCKIWDWRTADGRYKDMASRSLLLKLEKLGHITLPPRVTLAYNSLRNKLIKYVYHETTPIHRNLADITPIKIEPVGNSEGGRLFKYLLSLYHYIGYTGTVGENIKYLVFARDNKPLACLLFGSAAWRIEPRDSFIGWNTDTQKGNLYKITNNMRFLILPWVKVPYLASHILSKVSSRIRTDWINKYGHPVYLLESFVEQKRFFGTCYKAANWMYVGQTKGRTRNDRYSTIRVPIKDVYLYPLTKDFRERLINGS